MADIHDMDIALRDFDPQKDQGLDLWFQDSVEFGHGCGLRIKIKNILYNARSEFQEISVMETEKLGRVLVIDGITMLTEWDEAAYHEMICHVPLLVHPNPSKILVIGGGDGGTVREITKHPEVESIHVCEIDEEVVRVCREHLPSLASSFDDTRVEIFYRDGARYVKENSGIYDIIIVDSTDPLGPGRILFQRDFYEDLHNALTDEGIAVTQCESLYLHPQVISGVNAFAKDIFPRLGYYYTLVPTYPSGIIGFFFCSKKWDPTGEINVGRLKESMNLKYYTPDLHRASFTLPRFTETFFKD